MPAAEETDLLLAWLRGALEQPAGDEPLKLYAILDGARDERIVPKIRASGVQARCLLDGVLAPVLAAAAPYIVELAPDGPFTRALLADGWGDAWGVFLTSSASLDALRRHFRQFLRVADEDGRPLMFRYYDPRVLRVYLPTCTAEELDFVFDPVTAFLLEDGGEQGGALMRRARGQLEVTPRKASRSAIH